MSFHFPLRSSFLELSAIDSRSKKAEAISKRTWQRWIEASSNCRRSSSNEMATRNRRFFFKSIVTRKEKPNRRDFVWWTMHLSVGLRKKREWFRSGEQDPSGWVTTLVGHDPDPNELGTSAFDRRPGVEWKDVSSVLVLNYISSLVLQGFLPGFAGFYWVLLGFTGFYWVLLGSTGFYLVLLDIYFL